MASSITGSGSMYAGMYAGLYSGIAKAQAYTGVSGGNIDGAALFMNNPNVAALKAYLSAGQNQVGTLQKQQGYMGVIANALNSLGTLAQSMDASYNFGGMQATSSDPSVVTAAAGTNAKGGTAVITVTNIALAQTNYSNPVADATSAADFSAAYNPSNVGSITIQPGASAAQTFNVDGTTTLQSLANDINNNTESGVTASIVATSGGYSLQLTGLQTGASNEVTYGETGTTLGFQSNVSQYAVDAQYTLNGQSLTSPNNTVSNAQQGLTLQLNNASNTPEVINVAPNANEITNQVQSFVGAYNQVASAISAATNVNDPANLSSNAAVLNLQTALSNISIVPSASASGTYSSLADIGITQNSDGTLSINNVILQNAIASDPASVESIFVTTDSGTEGVADQMFDVANDYGGAGGILPSMSDSISNSLEAPDFGSQSRSAVLATYQNTIAQQYVNAQKSMARLQSQNMLIQALGR